MNWSDERYVRVYTRDTPEWLCLSFLAQGLFCLILRKVDRAGVMHLGRLGRRGVAVGVGHPGDWPRLEPALDELVADGCVRIEGDLLVVPNFIEAQEAEASDKARAKKHREVRRDLAKVGQKAPSRNVTERHENPELRDAGITNRDADGTERDSTVTPSRAVPCCTVPSMGEASPKPPNVLPMPARRRAGEEPKLGVLSAELRQRVEQGLGHGLIPLPTQAEADELERLVEAHGGLEQAIAFVAATCRKRDTDPQSCAWLLTVLRPSAGQGARP